MDAGIPDFDTVYSAYHDRVLEYAAKLIGRDAADDIAQEVFLKVSRSLGSLRDPSKLTSWIYAITINTVRDATKRRSAQRDPMRGSANGSTRAPMRDRAPGSIRDSSAVEPGSGGKDREGNDGTADFADTVSRTPEEIAIRHEMVRCYLDYVERLPANYYAVYVLREFEELSNEEIAHRLSLSLDTVKIRLHRAREKLHEELRQNCRCYQNERGELMGEPKGDELA